MNYTFLTDEEKKILEQEYRKITTSGISLILSGIFYIIIPSIFSHQINNSIDVSIRYIFLSITLLIAFLIRIVRSIILSKQTNTNFKNILKRLITSSIVTFALCELIAILGLVEYIITGIKMDLYLMVFLSFVFFIVHFPKKLHWEAYINSNIQGFRQ